MTSDTYSSWRGRRWASYFYLRSAATMICPEKRLSHFFAFDKSSTDGAVNAMTTSGVWDLGSTVVEFMPRSQAEVKRSCSGCW